MATSSISGLASGLDTASIIDQLMQLEAVPQNRLKSQQTTQKSVVSALQSLNTDVSLLSSRAESLAKPSAWQTLKGTSSTSDVTVTAGSAAQPASFAVTVDRLALAHQLGFNDAAPLTGSAVVTGSSVHLTTHDGIVHDLATGDGSLQSLVAAINGSTADTGVTATALRVADGSYRLLTQSTKTGATSDFTLTNADGSALLGGAAVRAGQDAQVSLGLGITATSSTNTFTELAPGISLTLSGDATPGRTSTITVAQDSSSVRATVKALVDQLNGVLGSIDSQSASATSTTAAGPLSGDPTVRSLRGALADTVFGGDNTSMASLGIQTDRFGKLVFGGDAFDKAYAADPAGTAAKFTTSASASANGFAARVAAVAKSASDGTTGTITAAITGRKTTIDRLSDDIAAWDDRLALRRTSLQQTYTALETALSNLQSQGNWLAGQLAHLPTSS
ncbi:flagellar filament capping protein FliD [Nocardioides sp. LS1]|uniref:flagellar filament capping protein FliD n=1 Tax=Nocardioides sp. LS1 TaxID=1027620 RepID=UPI000F6210DF|nr:flagellar filament capping protein FliD [Nocardioides sp. LS1]GCD89531.1 flagellar hook-associated protein 2 [Nocardioides sp. LS1]